jgi:aspartate racemase
VLRQRYLPGIVGGLGPAAHIGLEQRLISEGQRRGAHRDQDHLEWLLMSASATPDRTESILQSDTRACVTSIVAAMFRLSYAGAQFVAVACNTAHALRDEVIVAAPLPWLDILDVTCEVLERRFAQGARILVLQTTGTAQSGLYSRRLEAAGLEAVCFDGSSDAQKNVMQAIYDPVFGVKSSGQDVSPTAIGLIERAIATVDALNVNCIVPGCTELSLALERSNLGHPVVDPLDVLATAIYDVATGVRPLPN